MITGAYHLHWIRQGYGTVACNRNFPLWSAAKDGEKVNCLRCRKLYDAWMDKHLAAIANPGVVPLPKGFK